MLENLSLKVKIEIKAEIKAHQGIGSWNNFLARMPLAKKTFDFAGDAKKTLLKCVVRSIFSQFFGYFRLST